jgi:antitoxin component YwqK of YwqJK toxin-antitoxin module
MKTNAKKYFKKYLTNNQLYKRFGLLCFVPLFFSSCASKLFISNKKWDFMHAVLVNSNAGNVKMTNKRGDHIGWLNQGVGLESNVLTIDKLRPGYLKVTFSHPDRIDTTIKIKRTLRPGALIFDCTFGAILCGIPLLADFANVNIYKIKRSSHLINLNMEYNSAFYKRMYDNVNEKNDVDMYKKHNELYPKSPFKNQVQQKIYATAFNTAKNVNTISGYETYIKDYILSPFKDEAQNKVYAIAYAFAVNANTQAAFDDYIAKYPNAPNSDIAKQNRAKVKQIDDAYAAAKTSGTYNAYKYFLTTYEGTKYTSDIATKMATAYYNENNTKLKTLNDFNTSISLILDIEKQYKISCNKLKNLQDLRDNLIAEKLKPTTTKAQYLAILKEQSKAETDQESDDFEAYTLKERVFNNSNCNINGTYNLWAANGQKVIATYQNNKLNGDYTKYATDEKTVLEKGTYNNGNKTGTYLVNFESGKKQYEKNYNNGSLQTEIEYDENGKNLTALCEAEEKIY